MEIVGNTDNCISFDYDYTDRIYAIKEGTASINIYEDISGSAYLNIPVTVLPDAEHYTFQNKDYYCDDSGRVSQWISGQDFDSENGVATQVGKQSAFTFSLNGATSIGITYSCENVTSINKNNYATISLCRKKDQSVYSSVSIYGTNLTITRKYVEFYLFDSFGSDDLFIKVNHLSQEGSGNIYIKSIDFYYTHLDY